MNNTIKTIATAAAVTFAFAATTVTAQTHGRGDTVLTEAAFGDDVTTVDSLNIDTEINIAGNVFLQRSGMGNIATVVLRDFDAADVKLTHKANISGETNVGDEASLSEANVFLTGDMGTVVVNTDYQRAGKTSLGVQSKLNLGNVMVLK